MIKTDILVLGAGVAGLTFAIKMARKHPKKSVMVLTKTVKGESNTKYAQGGVAAVWDKAVDNYEKHIADTLDAGDGLCDEKIVEIVVKEGPKRVRELIKWGTRFDKKKNKKYDLGREGGHGVNRILHYKDLTGWEIQRALLAEAKLLKNIKIREHYFALEIITQHHLGHYVNRVTPDIDCYGVYILDKKTKKTKTILARITILATGGSGQIYRNTTNPIVATGDGTAMVYRANGRVANMEFVQFHPTALYNPAGENPSFLISEAVRGFGAVLKTQDRKEFMQNYDRRKSLAPRDIVARAIDNEMKKRGDDFVYLDCTHLDMDKFKDHFPTIFDKCMSIGIDVAKDYIPVVPACHYMCGGVKTDQHAQTSINRLYAIGETTSSGLHGANRLASNSLLEAMVFAHRAYKHASKVVDDYQFQPNIPAWNAEGTTDPKELVLITQSMKELKETMSAYVGIVRTDVRLKRALDRLHLQYLETEKLYGETSLSPQLCELRNIITVAYLTTKSASMRKESRGLHFTTDHPKKQSFIEETIL